MESGNVQCQILYFHSKGNHSPIDSIKGYPLSPIACACSVTHFIILDRDSNCYGFGINKDKQIDKKLPDTVSAFTKLEIIPNQTVREISAGDTFSAFILNNGWIVIHGQFYESEDDVAIFKNFYAPRGLSSQKGILSFAEKKENVIIMTENSKYKYRIKGYSIIKTAVSKDSVFALSANGVLFKMKIGKHSIFQPLKINFPVLTMFVSSNSLIFSDYNYKIYERSNDDKNIPIISPLYSQIVNAERSGNYLVRLDSKGYLSLTSPLGRPLAYKPFQVPSYKVSCFASNSEFLVVFRGDPVPPIKCAPQRFHCCSNYQLLISDGDIHYDLLAFDSENSYFRIDSKLKKKPDEEASEDDRESNNSSDEHSNEDSEDEENSRNNEFKELNTKIYDTQSFVTDFFTSPTATVCLAKDKKSIIYYTPSSSVIYPDADVKKSFMFNLLPGDIVETPSHVVAKFIGFDDGRVWLQPSKTRCVYSIDDPHKLKVCSRKGHTLVNAIVDGSSSVVDTTESFCRSFGHCCGDLLWYRGRGIVQFVGVLSNKLVLLDFSSFSLFTSEMLKYEVIRTMYNGDDSDNMISTTRTITTAEGEVVDLDICGVGKIFMPGDRVSSEEYGDSTYLGTDKNGNSYIQSDEMRLHDITAVKVKSIKKLKLIRRIGMSAKRTIKLPDGSSVTVSLSTNDRAGSNFMAGDFILSDGIRGKVIGIDTTTKKVYARSLENEDSIFEIAINANLLYRADILSGENSDFVEVGSPAFEVSNLMPDDVVRINNKNVYRFIGIGRSGLYFVDTKTDEIFATSFSPLVMTDGFEIVSRTIFPLRQ
ncbi:hypothetical protein M9Y10_012072 [Tritrichomonas musculus]|uniref:Cleavage/polyadenylation specificity factor A subunit C-terminal domain-containing protein n=1 Tax=Tritrichomonas musculus TaxID=1915356 RepID=A0ABR2ICB3_9EUKA